MSEVNLPVTPFYPSWLTSQKEQQERSLRLMNRVMEKWEKTTDWECKKQPCDSSPLDVRLVLYSEGGMMVTLSRQYAKAPFELPGEYLGALIQALTEAKALCDQHTADRKGGTNEQVQ